MRNPEIPDNLNNISPDRSEENRKKSIDFLRSLLDDWSDEVPDEVIRGYDENKNFKVRKNWFMAVVGQLELAAIDFLDNNKDLALDIKSFSIECTSKEFHESKKTPLEYVHRANDLLKRTLEYLESL